MNLTKEANNEISEKVRSWYEFSRDIIPDIDSRSFTSFVAGSSTLSTQVTLKAARYHFIIDPKSQTAYVDDEHKTIALPIWYLDAKVLRQMFGEDIDAEAIALSLANGSHIHEALHVRFTQPSKITDFYDTLDGTAKAFMMANQGVANVIMNVVEDLHIEACGKKVMIDFLNEAIATKNSLLFPKAQIEQMVKDADKLTDKSKQAEAKVQLFTACKNEAVRKFIEKQSIMYFLSSGEGILPSYRCSTEAKNGEIYDVRNRAFCAYNITKAILMGLSEAQRKELNDKMSSTEGGDAASSGKNGKLSLATELTPSKAGVEVTITEEEAEKLAKEFEGEAKMMMMAAKMKLAGEEELNKSSFGAIPAITYYDDIFEISRYERMVEGKEAENNFGFVNVLRQLRSKNHTTGPIRQSGARLINQRLYRISTDGKMFANPEVEKMEAHKSVVVILVDASGSMSRMYGQVLAEAKAMYKSLREASIPTIVFAHTSAVGDSGIPGLYLIIDGGVKRNDSQVDERFEAALHIQLSENYDGTIIEAVNKRVFADMPDNVRKLFFVLSDGQPSGRAYMGTSAIKHTMNVIEAVRKSNVFIASLSLVEGVVYSNDYIYGKEYNVNASAGLKRSFEKLVIRMQEEGRL